MTVLVQLLSLNLNLKLSAWLSLAMIGDRRQPKIRIRVMVCVYCIHCSKLVLGKV